jgi:hypothetical protein
MARKHSFEIGDTVIIYAKVTNQKVIDKIVASVLVDDVEVDGLEITQVARGDLVEKHNKEKFAEAEVKIKEILESLK